MERFGETQSAPAPETRDPQAERRERTLAELNTRLERLREFKPSGDRQKDINTFLELTDRSSDYLEEFRSGRVDPVETMREIRDFLEERIDPSDESYQTLDEHDPEYPAKHLFYREIPEVEIRALDAILRQEGVPCSAETGQRGADRFLGAEFLALEDEKKDRVYRLLDEKKSLQGRLVEIDEEIRVLEEIGS